MLLGGGHDYEQMCPYVCARKYWFSSDLQNTQRTFHMKFWDINKVAWGLKIAYEGEGGKP